MRVTMLLVALALSGCMTTSRPLGIGRDTYTVSATGDGFREAVAVRQSAFEAGRDLCEKQRKHFSLVSETKSTMRMGIDTTIDIIFRCLSETDPEYLRPEPQH